MPPDLFRGLSNLKEISLSGNNLSSVPPDLFRGLSNLQIIDLDENNLSSVPPDLFRGLSNLRAIWLNRNNLSSVPPDLFRGLSNLQEIWLTKNNLSSLPPDLFRGLSSLEVVYIGSGNDELTCLPQLPEGASYYSKVNLPPCDRVEITPDPLTPLIEGGNEENEREYTVEVNFTQKEIEDNKEVSLYVSSSDSEAVKVEHSHDGGTTWHSHKNPNEPVVFSPSTPSLPFRAVAVADEDNDDEEVTISHRLNGKDYPLEVEVHELKLVFSPTNLIFQRTAMSGTNAGAWYYIPKQEKTYTIKLNHDPQSNTVSIPNIEGHYVGLTELPIKGEISRGGSYFEFEYNPITLDRNNWNSDSHVVKVIGSNSSYWIEGPNAYNPPLEFPISHAIELNHSLELNGNSLPEQTYNVVNTIGTLALSQEDLEEIIRDTVKAVIEEVVGAAPEEIAKIVEDRVKAKTAAKVGAKIAKNILRIFNVTESIKDIINFSKEYKDYKDTIDNLNSFNTITDLFSNHLAANYHQLQQGTYDWRQAFSNRTFFQPFYLGNQAQQPQVPGVPDAPSPNLFLRAGFDYSSFDESDDVTDIDGDNMTYIFGLDFLLNPSIITGASLVIANSESDISDSESGIQATYDLDITSLHPYISWNASDRFSLFASLGYGKAHSKFNIDSFRDGTELADILLFYDPNLDVSNVPDGLDLSPLYTSTKDQGDFFSLSTGLDFSLWQADNSSLALSLQGSTTTLLAQKSSQASLGASLARTFPLDALTLESSLDLTWLMSDSGPGALELSGSFDVFPDTSNLSLLSSARVLLTGDRNEWGVSSTLRYQKNNTDEGLSLALYPSFGDSSSRLDINDFRAGNTSLVAANPSPPEPRLSAELAYGFRTGDRLLTPYTDLSFSTSYSDYTAGLRYQLDSGLDLDLNATHRNRPSGNNDNLFFLQLRSDL